MHLVIRFYRFLNTLSLDVVTGAVISALFFGKLFQVSIRPYGLIALGLTVWIIYTIDHLRDAKKIAHQASTERHRFHQRNFPLLIVGVGVALLLDVVTIFFIRKQILEWGLILFSIVILYLIGQRSLRFAKEVFIACLYSCGVLLPSLALTEIQMDFSHYLIIIQFGIIAWINLLMFSWFDYEFDQHDNQNSFVTIFGKRITRMVLIGLVTLNFCLAIILAFVYGITLLVFILLLMNTTLLTVFLFRNRLAKNDLYRLLGDAVFLLPLLFLL
jgi:hypothetical protein